MMLQIFWLLMLELLQSFHTAIFMAFSILTYSNYSERETSVLPSTKYSSTSNGSTCPTSATLAQHIVTQERTTEPCAPVLKISPNTSCCSKREIWG